jgi:hypothetical protein
MASVIGSAGAIDLGDAFMAGAKGTVCGRSGLLYLLIYLLLCFMAVLCANVGS